MSRGFQDLMRDRVRQILLVSSAYDSFILAEDGRLPEAILSEFLELNLRDAPAITHVATADEALAYVTAHPDACDLIISSLHVGDMDALALAQRVRQARLDVPVVLLAYDHEELSAFVARRDVSALDRIFLWQGDADVLLAIAKELEDRLNVAHDTASLGVQVVLVVEDNVRYYSSLLPAIYKEVLRHSARLVPEGLNLWDKLTRVEARPKVLLCTTFEQAWGYVEAYGEHLLGVISDVGFPMGGAMTADAGVQLARRIRAVAPDVPVVLQSGDPATEGPATEAGASFLRKGSPLLLNQLRQFMVDHFAFGDFVFRLADGAEVDRAADLRSLEEKLRTVPGESLAYHGERNHFSTWLKARTEFALAERLRPRKVSDFATVEDLRAELIRAIHGYRRERSRGTVADFDRHAFDASSRFLRIGSGSLGGKARGLAFVSRLLHEPREAPDGRGPIADLFPGVRIAVPPSLVLATDVFDEFLDGNDLRDQAVRAEDASSLLPRFLAASLPKPVHADLGSFLEIVRYPLAVRSSSLLEDSQHRPFAGIYLTLMLPNNHPDLKVRLRQLEEAIVRVYASTFSRAARTYLAGTPYRLEEEKMAVIVQRVVGSAHGTRFYPDFAGVARSHNFYPVPPLKSDEGIAAAALGLGLTVVEGGACCRFSPRHPQHGLPFGAPAQVVSHAQRAFYALDLAGVAPAGREHRFEPRAWPIRTAEGDGTLAAVGSTYSPENDAIYDGLSRPGVPFVSLAPVLKHGTFPLAPILDRLLALGSRGTSSPVEIEFAVTLADEGPHEFAFLQLRPLPAGRELTGTEVGDAAADQVLCRSATVLGDGRIDGIRDLVVVDVHRFDRARSRDAAAEVARFNRELVAKGRPYLLVGVGRWGSSEPFLGIPVTWDEIAGARVIVEAGFRDFVVTPSQGTHFFQNLASSSAGYFTVNPEAGDGFVDWAWLASQPAAAETRYVRHVRLAAPVVVKMNGRRNEGVILKP